MKKIVQRIAAKLTLLERLQQEGLNKDVVAATKTKMGADLSDALSGPLSRELLEHFTYERDRLLEKRFGRGDRVSFEHGGKKTAKVLEVSGRTLNLEYEGGYDQDVAGCTSADLEALTSLIAACNTLLMS